MMNEVSAALVVRKKNEALFSSLFFRGEDEDKNCLLLEK
jgi:hypothetical protein